LKLSDISIRRPVLASMMSAALVLFGIIGFQRLPVRQFPDVDSPIVSVNTTLRGANPRVVESAVTDILEEELSTIPGVRTLTSSSAEQSSSITLEFTLDRNLEEAANDVRDKVSRVRGRLPQEIEEPVVTKQDADAFPFFWMALSGENYDLLELSDIADRQVKTRLQSVQGVGRARVFGERRYAMRIWINKSELAARGLTVQDIQESIRSRNVEIPAGRIESDRREFTVRSMGELKTPNEFADLTVSNQGGQLVKLRDVARVELGPEHDRSALRYMGTPAVAIGVIRQSKSNQIEVSEAVIKELPAIQAALPPGVELSVIFDSSVFVSRSIDEAQETLILAGILVIFIIFIFLRNLRATFIPALAIPTSIVAAFGMMYFFDFTINNLTLLALILAIGIVVDDAIIVLENAYRHQEVLGKDPVKAARDGTREIAFAVIATTVALVAVFSPLAFLTGTVGRLFNEFALAMTGAVVVSSFVALTLTPMLCAKILRVPKSHGRVFNLFENTFVAITDGYEKALGWALRHRMVVIIVALGFVGAAVFLFSNIKREFVPPEDRGMFITITVAPEGASLAYTDGYQRQVEAILARTENVRGYFSSIGFFGTVNQGIIFSVLDDWDERDRTVQDVIAEVQPQYFGIPGIFAFANNPPAFGGFGNPVQFVVKHPNFEQLGIAMGALVARARTIPGLINVDTNLRVNKPELTIRYERDRAEDLGVPIRNISESLQALLGGQRISTFTRDNKLYDVIVQLEPEERATPSDMSGVYVRGHEGRLVKMDAIATVTQGLGPRQLNHYDRVRSFTLSANLDPSFTLGEALDSLNLAASEVLPEGSTIALAGESRELEESGAALYYAFILALIVVYMVLAAQFESLIHPFTVLLAVPLAITGALLLLYLTDSTLNLYSQIGMVLLIGIVTKNSILLVEYANQLQERGHNTLEAMIEASRIRLRPIIMTAFATIVGVLPIALGLGAGSASRRPLGYAIVGGLLLSTVLTLFLVPVAYVMIDNLRARFKGGKAESTEADPVPEVA
jgi:multidrug efflux pump